MKGDDKGITLFGTAVAAETEELPGGGCRTSAESGASGAAMCVDEGAEGWNRRRPGVDGYACSPRLGESGRDSDAALPNGTSGGCRFRARDKGEPSYAGSAAWER